MTDRIPLLIDTDPGVDDALALLMAFNDPRHELVGLTIAAGNVGLKHTVANALKLCEVSGVDVPVFAGAAAPLLHPSPDAGYVHGQDGFGDVGYEAARRQVEAEHAALAILRLSHEHAGKLLLVALGPLTNIALALKLDPTLPERVARFVVMGGAVTCRGNITPAAEFNIYFDPEAAHIVFEAFPRIELADWEAVIAHGFLHDDVVQWLRADSPRARFYERISEKTRLWSADRRGAHWHAADALAMAFALEPEGAVEVLDRALAIELEGQHGRGATVVDWRGEGGAPARVAILMRYDQERFQGLIRAALAAV
ncbi:MULTISPECIES: nucleoside hydrolase [unclassified Lysobacter]|uniref:nucleoside hydrolase n=1 Tax=unclassified Lysobacter TaxID=2635362 RepID=UPI0006F4967B|nr:MULTISPECIES: nucleoside hydrolase [unclassified Lysobacter]KQZ60367.1 nucleoside hydrolase [Lysobacter sp. Root559]KRA76759.1 nucleoside hydrolase [Lysobacter sp. Root667]KRC38808.1 nucleoside hydrolase [Lysobacter sp. Root76]KRD70988.1 nucleoside hydrolase [Lysobacter sp. Root96]